MVASTCLQSPSAVSVHVDQGDILAPLDVMASTGAMAALDPKANKASLDLLAHKESQESKVPRVCRGCMDGQGHRDHRGHPGLLGEEDPQDRQESKESKASRGCMGTQGHRGHLGHLGKTVKMEREDREDRQDRQDHKDHKDHKDDAALRGLRGGKGLEVDRARGVDQGKEDGRAREGHRGHQAVIAVTMSRDLAVTILRGLAAVASISPAATGMVSHVLGVQGTTT